MKTSYPKEEIQNYIHQYFEGNTSAEEEKILRNYFLQEDIDEDFISYRPLFVAWNDLVAQPEQMKIDFSLVENRDNADKSKILKYVRISTSAAAGIAACIILFFTIIRPKDTNAFVVIDGVKYTDNVIVKNAFDASMESVRIDLDEMFSDFHLIMEDL